MQKITPFLWFDRNAEEAMNLYVETFNKAPHSTGNSKVVTIQRYPTEGLEGPMQGFEGQVLTGTFELAGQTFMCLDGGPIFKPNESFSMLIDCKDQAEIDYFWEKLTADGGQESQCGWVKDKFGFSWQIFPQTWMESLGEKAGKAMHAMLQMKKIDMKKLEEAANQG